MAIEEAGQRKAPGAEANLASAQSLQSSQASCRRRLALWCLASLPLLACALALLLQPLRYDVLLVGHSTIDVVDKTNRPGGAVAYAAAALTALGLRACIVSTGAELGASLGRGHKHELHTLPAPATLAFEHSYTFWGHQRKLRVLADPNVTLRAQQVPPRCLSARMVILGPLVSGDMDAASFRHATAAERLAPSASWADLLALRPRHVGLLGQGLQRQLTSGGSVQPLAQPSPQLLAGLGPQVSLFLSDVETVTWNASVLQSVADASARLLVTHGEQGASEMLPGGRQRAIPPFDVGAAVDTNGAGDTFGTVYMVGLARGDAEPGRMASYAASRACLQPQSCKPGCAAERFASDLAGWTALDRLRMDVADAAALLARLARHAALLAANALQPLWQPPLQVLQAMLGARLQGARTPAYL